MSFNRIERLKWVLNMADILQELGDLIWLIIPLLAIQLMVQGLALWQWYKKKDYLGQNKMAWLLIILFVNFFGAIIFLIYSQKIVIYSETKEEEIDEWEV